MRSTRRTFFKAGVAFSSLKWHAFALETSPAADSSFDPWVEIRRDHLLHNVAEISRRVGSRPILAVIKNNGYGLGVVNVARILESSPAVSGFAVVKLHEAMSLRDAGIRKPVLLMGPFDEQELEEAVARDILPMLYTPLGKTLDRIAASRHKPVTFHLCVDTGLGRVGVPYQAAPKLIRDLARRRAAHIAGIMMTFSEDPEFDKEQLGRFRSLCHLLEQEGIPLGNKHAASSFALFQHPDSFLDMVRPGMALYGVYPENEFRRLGVLDLRPAVSLKARVIYVKQLRKGESAGYSRVYRAKDDVWVATLPVGHADGLPRQAAKGARIRIGGELYPVVAVSASHSIVELGPEPRVQTGDVAAVFDWQEGSRPEDVSASCGASVYDLTMHLSPLLPRREYRT